MEISARMGYLPSHENWKKRLMGRPTYLNNYRFNWETFDIMASGTSSLDARNYLADFGNREDALRFLNGYGYDLDDPIQNAEMFGNFQEALQFIKR